MKQRFFLQDNFSFAEPGELCRDLRHGALTLGKSLRLPDISNYESLEVSPGGSWADDKKVEQLVRRRERLIASDYLPKGYCEPCTIGAQLNHVVFWSTLPVVTVKTCVNASGYFRIFFTASCFFCLPIDAHRIWLIQPCNRAMQFKINSSFSPEKEIAAFRRDKFSAWLFHDTQSYN